jgi:TonB family protein
MISIRRPLLTMVVMLSWPAITQAQTAVPKLPDCIAKPFATTSHPIPPYPTYSARMHEQGTATLVMTIQPDGTASDAQIAGSSGSDRLDQAAAFYLRKYWRWAAFDSACAPNVKIMVNIVWDMRSLVALPVAPDGRPIPEIRMTPSDYPAAALAAREQGSTMIQGTLGTDGVVRNWMVTISSGYPDLDAKTLFLAQDNSQNFWTPNMVDGKAIATQVFMTVHWSLTTPRLPDAGHLLPVPAQQ